MQPQVARVAAYAQVLIVLGTIPVAILAGLVALPFGLTNGAIASTGVFVVAMGMSALGIPIFGFVISKLWLRQKRR